MRPKFHIRTILALTALVAVFFCVRQVLHRLEEWKFEQRKQEYYRTAVGELSGQLKGDSTLQVVAADTREPIAFVIVQTTLIGPDGGDGGFHAALTDSNGVAHLHPSTHAGRYQYSLLPSPSSRYRDFEWRSNDPLLRIGPDGACSIKQLELQVK